MGEGRFEGVPHASGPSSEDIGEATQALERVLDAVADGELTAPPGFVQRLEGALLAMRELLKP